MFTVFSVCLCVCVCVFSVCVCLCISKDTLIMLVLVTTHATHATLNKITCLTQKSMPNTISLSYSTTMLFRPTNPCAKKLPSKFYFEFLYSIFFFLPPPPPPPPPPPHPTPHGFLFSVCLLMKPPQNLSKTLPQIQKSKQP